MISEGCPGHAWSSQDLNAATVAVASATGSKALSSFDDTDYNVQLAFYIGTDQHVHDFFAVPGHSWSSQDLTAAVSGAVAATPGSALTTGSPLNSWSTQGILVNIIGQVTGGGTGVVGATISLTGTSAAGTTFSLARTTDTNGAYSFFVPFGGTYTVTPTDASGDIFQPSVSQPLINLSANETVNFTDSETTTLSSTSTAQPIPVSAPLVNPPGVIVESASAYSDVSGTWAGPQTSTPTTYSLSQSGSIIAGAALTSESAYGCGSFTSTVSGSASSGNFNLTVTAPAYDACGYPITNRQASVSGMASCSQAQVTISSSGSGASGFLGSGGSGSGVGGSQSWTRTSSPPGLQILVDIMNDKVTTTTSGQNKSATLSVAIQDLSFGNTTSLASHPGAGTSQSFADSLERMTLPIAVYGNVTATWDDISVTVSTPFDVLGTTRLTQYNTPYEYQCTNSSSAKASAYICYKIDANNCYWQTRALNSAFITQVTSTGTGVLSTPALNSGTVVKAYNAGAKNVCPLPASATTSNSFFTVDVGGNTITKVQGGNPTPTVLSDASETANAYTNNNPAPGTLAVPVPGSSVSIPTVLAGNYSYLYGQRVLLVTAQDQNDSLGLRLVEDICPACNSSSTLAGNSNHFDVYNSSPACGAYSVPDYGHGFVTINLR